MKGFDQKDLQKCIWTLFLLRGSKLTLFFLYGATVSKIWDDFRNFLIFDDFLKPVILKKYQMLHVNPLSTLGH